jgi:hypothetical protein
MHKTESDRYIQALRELLPVMPRLLQRRRSGLAAEQQLAKELGIDTKAFMTMAHVSLVVGSYGGKEVSYEQLKGWDPYATVDASVENIANLKQEGLLLVGLDGKLSLSPQARSAIDRFHEEGRAYVAALKPLCTPELESVAHLLEAAVSAVLFNPMLVPRPGSHLAASRALALGCGNGRDVPALPVMLRIEQAVSDLWLARDDAHVNAWRYVNAWNGNGLTGPTIAVLTEIWSGTAHTVGELAQELSWRQTARDVESNLSYLVWHDYVKRDGEKVRLTRAGVLLRDSIEAETDRIYFIGWQHARHQVEWLRDKLKELVSNLPEPA